MNHPPHEWFEEVSHVCVVCVYMWLLMDFEVYIIQRMIFVYVPGMYFYNKITL